MTEWRVGHSSGAPPPTHQLCMAIPETAAKDEGHIIAVVRLHEAGPAVPVHVGPVHKLVQINWNTGVCTMEGGEKHICVNRNLLLANQEPQCLQTKLERSNSLAKIPDLRGIPPHSEPAASSGCLRGRR